MFVKYIVQKNQTEFKNIMTDFMKVTVKIMTDKTYQIESAVLYPIQSFTNKEKVLLDIDDGIKTSLKLENFLFFWFHSIDPELNYPQFFVIHEIDMDNLLSASRKYSPEDCIDFINSKI